MAKLAYRTRGNSNPQGKERVFFACHPEDFNAYFESVCEDIFKTQNCAIWYDREPENDWTLEEMELELGMMQLFVVPVTARFLYQKNSAREILFRFAVDHCIPVLPLMQESGLEEAFNCICGDLQFLDKDAALSDPTALPYDQRLEQFLSSVLLGDELAEKVRSAFDAYIFLSYRKKDRKYAQELMSLIHQNDFCRDIAIWYDEFLVPGEDFNHAIQDAMEKSELFTFVVTPNLLEQDNYVMTTEYPVAKKTGKPLLPVEMAVTDREELQKSFAEIPDPTDAQDVPALSDALLKSIRSMAIEENDSDPGHLFFIGLAYLNGIDVEVNQERALSLILQAAEGGLEEAIAKLADMYRRGDGVSADYEQTIYWQKRLIKERKKRYEKEKTQENANRYFYAMIRLHDDVWNRQDLEQSEQVCLEMLSLAEERQALNDAGDFLLNEALISYSLGANYHVQGNLAQARLYYEKAMATAEKAGEAGDILWSVCGEKMSEVLTAAGDLAGAHTCLSNCLERYLKKRENGETVALRRRLGYVFYSLGGLYLQMGDMKGASMFLTKGESIQCALVNETRAVNDCLDLIRTRQVSAQFCIRVKDYEKAYAFLKRNLETQSVMEHEGKKSVWLEREKAGTLARIAEICEETDNLQKAKGYGLEAMRCREQLAQQSRALEFSTLLSKSYLQMCRIYKKEGNLPEAREYGEKARKIQLQLASVTNSVENDRTLSLVCAELGELYMDDGDLQLARELLEESLELEKSLDGKIDRAENLDTLSKRYCQLGDLCKKEGKNEERWECYEKGMFWKEQLVEEFQEEADCGNLTVLYGMFSLFASAEGKQDTAQELQMKMAALCETQGRRYDAVKDYGKAISWFSRAVKTGSVLAAYYLGIYYNKGRGVELNIQTAAKYMTTAAQAGYAPAQDQMGDFCYYGLTGAREYVKAAEWYLQAALQGHKQAKEKLKKTVESMNFMNRGRWKKILQQHGIDLQ